MLGWRQEAGGTKEPESDSSGHREAELVRRGNLARRAFVLAVFVLGALSALTLTASANHSQTELHSIGSIGGNGNLDASYSGISADGSHVIFETREPLVAADTDTADDVYERFGGTTTLVSIGSLGGNNSLFDGIYAGVSADGAHVFFETDEPLASTDTDTARDVYERSGGVTTQVSTGPGNGNTANGSFFVGTSTDGTKVFFVSYDNLTSEDTDNSYRDIYMRSGGTTTLISTSSTNPDGNFGSDFDAITPDGSRVYFHTDEGMVAADTDGRRDVYERAAGTTNLISTGPINGNLAFNASFRKATSTGSHVFFETSEKLTSSDTDSNRDVYDRTGGTTNEISIGLDGGNGAYDAGFGGTSADGSKTWFFTREPIVSGDTDGGCEDPMGAPTLKCLDVYERAGGGTTWISSGGNGAYEASFAAASDDGSKVFFHTKEQLAATDGDGGASDVYLRSGGVTTQVSVGGTGPYTSDLVTISPDGARVFFHTYESLVAADTDGNWNDIYERYGGETTLVSTGPASTNAEAFALYVGATADGTKIFFETNEVLTSDDTDASQDVYSASTAPSSGFPRPRGATPVRVALVPAYQECTTPNRTHGAPLSSPSCNPPQQESAVLTVGTGDANGFTPQSTSSIKYLGKAGAAGPPEDSDVNVVIAVNDVRCRVTNAACPGGSGSAYTGMILVRSTIRATDKYNGSPPAEPATAQDFPLEMPVSCMVVSATAGSACNLTTSANSFYPGLVLDSKRSNWELAGIDVMDAGPNGTGYTLGCPSTCGDGDETVFMRPGIWVP
jgi:hypothetical protein